MEVVPFKDYCLEKGNGNREWECLWPESVCIRQGDLIWDNRGNRWIDYPDIGPSCCKFGVWSVNEALEKIKRLQAENDSVETLIW